MSAVRGARPVTLGDWVTFAEKLYAREKLALGQIATNAHDEALYLVLTVLKLPLDSEARVLKKTLTVAQAAAVKEILHRRAMERVPAAGGNSPRGVVEDGGGEERGERTGRDRRGE